MRGSAARGRPAINDVIDDVRMYVRIDSIDGPGEILAMGGPLREPYLQIRGLPRHTAGR